MLSHAPNCTHGIVDQMEMLFESRKLKNFRGCLSVGFMAVESQVLNPEEGSKAFWEGLEL